MATTETAKTASTYIPTLDGWRAVAILGVLVCHGLSPVFKVGGFYENSKLSALFSLGAFGVPIFFAISGYLITSRLLLERATTGTISLRNFYTRRVFRILPASVCYMVVVAALQGAGLVSIEGDAWLSSLLFFKNLVVDQSWYLSHFWSLSIEEQFYFVWPFAVSSVRTRSLLGAAAFVCGVSLWLQASQTNGLAGMKFDGILWGCGAAFAVHRESLRLKLREVLNPYVMLSLVPICFGGMINKLPLSPYWLSLVFALLVVGTVLRPEMLGSRLLEQRTLKTIGKWSYSIYLWQQLFCVSSTTEKVFGAVQLFPLNLVASIACAYLSFRFVETPLIAFGHRLSAPKIDNVIPFPAPKKLDQEEKKAA